MRPHPPTNGLPTVENGLPTVCQRPYQRYVDALPTGCVPTPPPIPPKALEAAFSGAFGPHGGSPRRGKLAGRVGCRRPTLSVAMTH
jgi:hypothetical protein